MSLDDVVAALKGLPNWSELRNQGTEQNGANWAKVDEDQEEQITLTEDNEKEYPDEYERAEETSSTNGGEVHSVSFVESDTEGDSEGSSEILFFRPCRRSSSNSEDNESKKEFFCVEDTFLASDIQVSVEGVGRLNFPIDENVIRAIMKVSEKAVFGKGEQTLLDTAFRDTQVISAEKLSVQIDEQSLMNVLRRVRLDLNMEISCILIPHLYNMLVYGPGQFFKMHQDSEKIPNMIATMIIVLPSPHKGGDLIIRHNEQKHRFFGSTKSSIVKCIAFYPDCFHEVLKVVEGYRVALTYNIELRTLPISEAVPVSQPLRDAVVNYFGGDDKPDKLVYLLDYHYTERNLRLRMMKGTDRTRAYSLFSVAKQEGFIPCLALANYYKAGDEPEADPELCEETSFDLYFWVDEGESTSKFKVGVSDEEICYTARTEELFKPYKEVEGGYWGNSAATNEYWYKRACVVLWESPWSSPQGFEAELRSLHNFTTQPGMQGLLSNKIKENFHRFFRTLHWTTGDVTNMLLDLCIYLGNGEVVFKILSKLSSKVVLNLKNDALVSLIERSIDVDTWKKLIASWNGEDHYVLLWHILHFLLNYIVKDSSDIQVSNCLFDEVVVKLTEPPMHSTSMSFNWNDRETCGDDIVHICALVQACKKLRGESEQLKLIDQIVSSEHNLKIETIEGLNNFRLGLGPELFNRVMQSGLVFKIISKLTPNQVKALEKTAEGLSWLASCINLEICKELMVCWKRSLDTDMLIKIVFKILDIYLSEDSKCFPMCHYLLEEAVGILSSGSRVSSQKLYNIVDICIKLGRNDLFDLMVPVFGELISNVADLKQLRIALSKDLFDRVGPVLLEKIADRIFLRIDPPEQNKSDIQEVLTLLKTSADLNYSLVEQKILTHLIAHPAVHTADFLGDLLTKLIDTVKKEEMKKYISLQIHTLQLINLQLDLPCDWSLSVAVSCCCQYCCQINEFLRSGSQSSITIPAPEIQRKHIKNSINALDKIPIKYETVGVEEPFKLSVTKLPDVGIGKQKQLLTYKEKIENAFIVKAEAVSEIVDVPAKVMRLEP